MDTTQTTEQGTPQTAKRMGGIAQAVLVGGSMAGGGTAVFALIELVRTQPDKAFPLLQSWGPWFVLAMFIAWVLSKLGDRLLDVMERLGDRVADAMENVATEQKKQAEAMQSQALALQAKAATDDRERERLSTMVDYGAQQARQALEIVREQGATLGTIVEQLQHLVNKGTAS